ncbi:MAG: sulfatase [bacterium]|nr:sulfatase [bacterium]
MLRVLVALGLLVVGPGVAYAAGRPDVVFLLLDTTRADRLGVYGNPRPTSPALDGLARDGVVFERHYANSHATRPSMPQLASGRYYHENVLRSFEPQAHPREFPWNRPDPTAVLLPALLRDAGYRTLGVSAHPWVVANSTFGAGFASLELVPFEDADGHGDATQVVDRALALWDARDRSLPTFLYLHFMDAHLPRRIPPGRTSFLDPAFDWKRRFDAGSWPTFGAGRRLWSRGDATDFTPADRRHMVDVYDTLLQSMDEHIGRLLAGLRRDDPALARTLLVVTADHGEELGEQGRLEHTDTLADGVQHIPWIMAGAGIVSGQRLARFTENVDVMPTLAAAAGVPLPAGVVVDGRVQLEPDGRLRPEAGRDAAAFAWETYRGLRSDGHLLRARPAGALDAHCEGARALFRVHEPFRHALHPRQRPRLMGILDRTLADRLDAPERSFLAARYGPPNGSVTLRAEYWTLSDQAELGCRPVGPTTTAPDLDVAGWFWTGRGVATLTDDAPPLPVELHVPDGTYRAELTLRSLGSMPALWGFATWRRGFRDAANARIDLGPVTARDGVLMLPIPPAAARYALGVRLTPAGVAATGAAREPVVDDEQRKRLQALGYVD